MRQFIVLRQHFIRRYDLRANPTVRYIFGDNLAKTGFGGQAHEMRGEPNAYGISTKLSPDTFARDIPEHLALFTEAWDQEFPNLLLYKDWTLYSDPIIIVFPLQGIGKGLADMPNKAPLLYAILKKRLETSLGLRDL